MKRPFWITLTVSASVCAAGLTAQSMKNRSLAEKLARQNAVAGEAENRRPEIEATAATSDERIERARSGLDKLTKQAGEQSLGEDLEEALRMVQGLSLDELIAVTRDLPSSRTRRFLVKLAAEQDARRVSGDEKLTGDFYIPDIERMIAKQDLDGALDLLPKPEPPQYSASCLQCHGEGATKRGGCIYRYSLGDGWGIATAIFSEDVEVGLRAFLQMEERDFASLRLEDPLPKLAISGSIPLDDGQLPAIAAALNNPEFESIRADIINLALTDAIYDEGVAAMAKRAKSLSLSEADLKTYMDRVIGNGSGRRDTRKIDIFFTEPESTLQWVAEARSEAGQREMIPGMVLNWANRDVKAAFEWIGKQAPSPVRDASIAEVLTKAPSLDGKSAAGWALEIQDPQLRSKTLKQVSKTWKQQDPAAAEAWFKQQQGLSK